MVKRREAESLEPTLGEASLLHEVGGPARDEIPSLCITLTRARMTAGFELKDVSAALRIRLLYLEALEEGRFDDLPGMTYVVGFLRSYSEFLGLDPDEMIVRLKSETTSGIVPHDLTFPMPPKQGGKPKPWLILVVLVLAGLAYGGWRVYSTEGRIATNLVSDVSTKLTEATGLSDNEVVREAATTKARAGEEPSVAQSMISRQQAPEEYTQEPMAQIEQGGNAVPRTAAESQSAGISREEQSPSGVLSGTASSHEEPAQMAGRAADTEAANDVAAPNERREFAASTPDTGSWRSDSLWDRAAQNQPNEVAALSQAASSETVGTSPIVRNANAQDLDGAENSANIDVASASPELSGAPVHEPTIYGVENTDFRITIKATADSWVQIQGPNNELLLTRILRTGDIYRVPDRSGLVMVTGNAGALEVRVDGALVAPLGPIGVVRRNISLDLETLVASSEASR